MQKIRKMTAKLGIIFNLIVGNMRRVEKTIKNLFYKTKKLTGGCRKYTN